MTYRVVLEVAGVDLDDEHVLEVLDASPHELSCSAINGFVSATVFCDQRDPVGHVVDVARWLEGAVPHATVSRIDEELVSVRDVADELGMSREAVRLWTTGKRRGDGAFPRPRAFVGGGRKGPTQLWAWGDITTWLAQTQAYPVDYEALSNPQVAELNALFQHADDRTGLGAEWQTVKRRLTAHTAAMAPTQPWNPNLGQPIGMPRQMDRARTTARILSASATPR